MKIRFSYARLNIITCLISLIMFYSCSKNAEPMEEQNSSAIEISVSEDKTESFTLLTDEEMNQLSDLEEYIYAHVTISYSIFKSAPKNKSEKDNEAIITFEIENKNYYDFDIFSLYNNIRINDNLINSLNYFSKAGGSCSIDTNDGWLSTVKQTKSCIKKIADYVKEKGIATINASYKDGVFSLSWD